MLLASHCLAADAKKVVIPFDFVSTFDGGRYGQMMGDMVWKKLSQQRGFVVPQTMLDVRDYCASHHLRPSPEMELEKMAAIVRNDFDAQIGIWGSVERAPGAESEVYDLVIKCVDFSAPKEPKVICEIKTRTKSASEIPHVYVQELVDALTCQKPAGPLHNDALVEANWKRNPNLVVGDFERGAGGVPKGWEAVAGQQREPLGGLVRWTTEDGNPKNKVIRFTLDRNVAENEGLMYYSDPFPVEKGATYRFRCRWRSTAPAVKVFIKCYDEVPTSYGGQTGQQREVYRSQQNLKGPSGVWNTHTEDFTPKHPQFAPKSGRVMLYAYLSPGVVEFDDVVVKQIAPPPADQALPARE